MAFRTLGMYVYSSVIGWTRLDAPRNPPALDVQQGGTVVKILLSTEDPSPVKPWFKIQEKFINMPPGPQKYASLPGIDDAAPEIYETPELADDVSTPQTATQRSNSLASSDELDLGRHDSDTGLDRHRIDRNEARRRFEPARVDATDVNFSDRLATGRKSYKISTRRRRRRYTGEDELGDLSDSEDESLERKLARLKREAEEVRLEVQKREQEKEEGEKEEDGDGMQDSVEQLSRMLNGLYAPPRRVGTSTEAALSKKLAPDLKDGHFQNSAQAEPNDTSKQPSTLTSLASLSDRLTVLETSLGLSTTTSTSTFTSTTPILPILKSLTSQLNTLTTTLSPPSSTSNPTTNSSTTSTINLDTLTTRIRDLITQSDRLTSSRKAATEAATDLRQARLKAATTASASSSSTQYQRPPSLTPHKSGGAAHQETETVADLLGYEDQSSKISALYATLPRIQELSPLLPVVLERLRGLQGIHAGAATARADLDVLERVQGEVGTEIGAWKQAVEKCEEKVREAEGVIKGNKDVVGGLVRGVEDRLARLERR